MPPYVMYRGGLPPLMISGRYFSASSSHVVTCARMSFTDQSPMTPGSISRESGKPAYDSLIAAHAWSSFFRSCCLFMVQALPLSYCDVLQYRHDTGQYRALQLSLLPTICASIGMFFIGEISTDICNLDMV